MYGPYDEYGEEPEGSEDIAKLVMALLRHFGFSKEESTRSSSYNGLQPNDEYFSNALNQQQQQEHPQLRSNPYANTSQKGNFGKGTDLMSLIRQKESSGNYRASNKLGFTGAYQFGAPALETVGYLKKGAGKRGNSALKDPSNWTIPGGQEAFLSSRELQDQAFKKLSETNKRTLQKLGVINSRTDPRTINAMLAAAHISGPGGVQALMRGQNRKDAAGGSAQSHWDTGWKASY